MLHDALLKTPRAHAKGKLELIPFKLNAPHMALEGVTSLRAMTVKTQGCFITWGPLASVHSLATSN